jgi:hypothetical protein
VSVTSSSYTTAPQIDGRERVTESHLLADGRVVSFEYLADASVDKALVLSLRAERVAAEIAAREQAESIAADGTVALTKLQFRRLFSPTERAMIDAFNAGFEAHPALTDEQKAGVRTALADYTVASDIRLDDEATIAALYMYEALGLIAVGRAAEILGG